MFTVYVPQSILIMWHLLGWRASFLKVILWCRVSIWQLEKELKTPAPPLKMLIFHLQSKLICLCVCSPQCSPWGEPQNPFFWRLSHCGTLISWLHTSALGSLVFMDSNHAFSMLCQFIKEVEHQFSFCSDFDAQVNFFLPRLHMPSYRWQDDDDGVH